MAISPTTAQRFSTESIRLAAIAKALAHPARIEILTILAKQDSCMCGDIVETLPLSQSTVSQHLSELKSARLIKGTIDGPKVCYCLDAEGIAEARALLGGTLDALTQSSIKTSAVCR
jgi:DNA-binding transcriptional ArsR family regulator